MKNLRLTILFTALVALGIVALVTASQIDQSKDVSPLTPNTYHVGDTISYVLNTGNPAGNTATNTISDIHDHLPNGTLVYQVEPGVDPPLVQTPGQSATFNLDYVVGAADVVFSNGARRVINQYHAAGVDSLEDNVTATVERNSRIITPCIDVNKTVEPTTAIPGADVVYTYTICNCGDTNLTLTDVNDDRLGDLIAYVPAAGLVLTGGVYNGEGQLQAGECTTFTVNYTVQEGDPDPLCNEVCVTGVDLIGGPAGTVEDCDPACLDIVEPNVTIAKTCDEYSKVGDVIDYDVTITNSGTTDLEILSVIDTVADANQNCVGDILPPAGTCSFSYPYTVQLGDPDPLINTVTVIAKAVGVGVDVNVTDSTTCETDLVNLTSP